MLKHFSNVLITGKTKHKNSRPSQYIWTSSIFALIKVWCIQVTLCSVPAVWSAFFIPSSLSFYCGRWPCHSFTDNCFLTMFLPPLLSSQRLAAHPDRILMPCSFTSERGSRGRNFVLDQSLKKTTLNWGVEPHEKPPSWTGCAPLHGIEAFFFSKHLAKHLGDTN